jgi:hypothetical protein
MGLTSGREGRFRSLFDFDERDFLQWVSLRNKLGLPISSFRPFDICTYTRHPFSLLFCEMILAITSPTRSILIRKVHIRYQFREMGIIFSKIRRFLQTPNPSPLTPLRTPFLPL